MCSFQRRDSLPPLFPPLTLHLPTIPALAHNGSSPQGRSSFYLAELADTWQVSRPRRSRKARGKASSIGSCGKSSPARAPAPSAAHQQTTPAGARRLPHPAVPGEPSASRLRLLTEASFHALPVAILRKSFGTKPVGAGLSICVDQRTLFASSSFVNAAILASRASRAITKSGVS